MYRNQKLCYNPIRLECFLLLLMIALSITLFLMGIEEVCVLSLMVFLTICILIDGSIKCIIILSITRLCSMLSIQMNEMQTMVNLYITTSHELVMSLCSHVNMCMYVRAIIWYCYQFCILRYVDTTHVFHGLSIVLLSDGGCNTYDPI